MTKRSLRLSVAGSMLLAGIFLGPSSGPSHPVWDPYDDTRFAPVDRFGPRIGLETIVPTGTLLAPNKGVVAPGLPNYLFIVDQPGKLWALELTSKKLTLVHDFGQLLVRLGVFFGPLCPPGNDPDRPSFDERGLLGVAFHPDFQSNRKFYTYTSEPFTGIPPTFPTTLPLLPSGAYQVNPDHQNVVSEWTAVDPKDPAAGVTGERRILMRVDWPQFNHDGGDLAFDHKGLLYISMGDGGGADDRDGENFIVPYTCGQVAPMVGHGEDGNAQKLTNPLGKILRIDPTPSGSSQAGTQRSANQQYAIPSDNPLAQRGSAAGLSAGVPEIFAWGFRNPFRMSFDTTSHRLFVGDVGQNDIEEVDIVVKGGNYGWRVKEGTLFFCHNFNDPGFATPAPVPDKGCATLLPPSLIDPIAQFDTHHEGHSVIGGFVYHGTAVPGLAGRYVFGDFSRLFKFPAGPHDYGRLFHIPGGGGQGLRTIREFNIVPSNAINLGLLGFGQDAAGEIYVMGNVFGLPFPSDGEPPMPEPKGVVMRLAPEPVIIQRSGADAE
jgi:glucose/arabinose dehydrogenase